MPFTIIITPSAQEDIQYFKVYEQRIILNAIRTYLKTNANIESNRRKLEPLEVYRTRVQKLLEDYKTPGLANKGEIETQLIVDTKNDHYQLVHVGWQDEHRIYTCVSHIDIKGDKVWLQQNMTDQKVADDLVALGIPKEQIVLGFQPPYARKYTGFAVN